MALSDHHVGIRIHVGGSSAVKTAGMCVYGCDGLVAQRVQGEGEIVRAGIRCSKGVVSRKNGGCIAARESVRLKAKHVAWAPVIRDEGNSTIEVGAGDRAFVEAMLSAYDTEKRLQAQGLAPKFSIESLVIEAGPSFFDSAVKEVGEGIESRVTALKQRDTTPYASEQH